MNYWRIMKNVTAAQRAAQLGVSGKRKLSEIAEIFGCTRNNLEAKFKSKPEQFDIIVLGCLEYRRLKQQNKE